MTTILPSAFYGCTGLKELTLPICLDVACKTGSKIWEECENIEKVTFTTGNGVGYDYGGLVTFADSHNVSRTPWKISKDSLTTVVFEEGITHIGSFILYGCNNITSISIPETVVSIGASAFEDCILLTSLTLPNSLSEICDNAFEDCNGLKELTIPISIDASQNQGSYIWEDCESIEKVTFIPGNGVGYDYGDAYSGGHNVSRTAWKISKDSLTTVVFEEGITHIGSFLLYECEKITSIVIPNTVTSIGESAFEDCTSLTDISLPVSVKDIGRNAFRNCPGYIPNDSSNFYENDFMGQTGNISEETTIGKDDDGSNEVFIIVNSILGAILVVTSLYFLSRRDFI